MFLCRKRAGNVWYNGLLAKTFESWDLPGHPAKMSKNLKSYVATAWNPKIYMHSLIYDVKNNRFIAIVGSFIVWCLNCLVGISEIISHKWVFAMSKFMKSIRYINKLFRVSQTKKLKLRAANK